MAQDDERLFENEVRRVARQLWPEDQFSGARMLGGRERDGIFVTEDLVNIIESTVSRRKDKAEDERKKLVDAARELQKKYPEKLMKGWFITRDEPTVDQRAEIESARGLKITICSFETFRIRLVDAGDYLDCRNRYRFGSVVNLDDGSDHVLRTEYIEPDIFALNGTKYPVQEITKMVTNRGGKILLLGDYGAGKSMTLREVFYQLRAAFHQKTSIKFPLYLNLRDHHSQRDPDEVLARHANLVGFAGREQLVRAWRAGYVDLLLDGFDELATAASLGITKKLKQIRYQTTELVRSFIRQSPAEVGIIVSGRRGYFDNDAEMRQALDVGRSFTELALSDLSEDQLRKYLKKKGMTHHVPDWVPARPLLVGYLVANRGFQGDDGGDGLISVSPAEGWQTLFHRICQREARIETNLDSASVQMIIERLATLARARADSLGPVYPDDIRAVFEQIVGYQPDDRGQMLLMRLPGLGPHAPEDGSRRFVDPDLADVARSGDLYRFVEDPFGESCRDHLSQAVNGVGPLGISVVAQKCIEHGFGSAKISTAIKRCKDLNGADILRLDLLDLLIQMGISYEDEKIAIREVIADRLEIPSNIPNVSRFQFENCIFSHLSIDPEVPASNLPKFVGCEIAVVEGRVSIHDLPEGVFEQNCRFETFADARTNVGIFELDLPEGTKVLLSILTKLFLQSGGGRRESALSCGLDHRSRRLVPDVLGLLQREKVAVRTHQAQQVVWIPMRDQSARVRRILASPSTSNDLLVKKSAAIS
jgi:hypothetical protein